jgi:hypothetical protein
VTALNRTVAAVVIAAVVLALVAGFSTGQGQVVASGTWHVVATIGQWAAASLIRLAGALNTAGNGVRAIVAAVVLFAVSLLSSRVRAGGVVLVAVVLVVAAFGFVMYQPTVLAGVAG